MIRRRRYKRGLMLDRSLRSYALNTALRLFVKPQFKSDTKPPAEMRQFMQKYIEARARFHPGTRHWEDPLGGVPSHWFRAGSGDARGALLYLHGGAFVVETPRAHGAFVSELAARCGMIAVDAKLPPGARRAVPGRSRGCHGLLPGSAGPGLRTGRYRGGRGFCRRQPDPGPAAAGAQAGPAHAGRRDSCCRRGWS